MQFVPTEVENYCLEKSTLPSNLCDELEDFTWKNVPMPQMVSGKMVGSFLAFLVRALGARHILEIGTFTGHSALNMAENIPDAGRVETIDVDPNCMAVAREYWKRSKHGHKILSYLGSALEIVPKLPGPFDLVFIDADKTNYLNYLKLVLEKGLLSQRGVIVLDNCLWSGRVLTPAQDESTRAIQEVNDFIASRPDLQGCLLPLRDGLFLVTRR